MFDSIEIKPEDKPKMKEKKLIGTRCKNVQYTVSSENPYDDLAIAKLVDHYDDGSLARRCRVFKNPKRPVWITKPQFRTHKEHKEYESVKKLDSFKVNQASMVETIKRKTDIYIPDRAISHPTDLNTSPYLYGTSIHVKEIIKNFYNNKCPDLKSPTTLGIMDIETFTGNYGFDRPEEHIITHFSLCTIDRGYLAVTKDYLNDVEEGETPMTPEEFKSAVIEYVKFKDPLTSKYMKEVDVEVFVVEDEIEVIKVIFENVHALSLDVCMFFNIGYDMEVITKRIDYHIENNPKYRNLLPGDLFCHPDVPREYRNIRFVKGREKRANGSPADFYEKWSYLNGALGYFLGDYAQLFKGKIRAGSAKEEMNLNAFLKKHAGIKKVDLSFPGSENCSSDEKHKIMAKRYKIEYGAYSLFDSYGLCYLDNQDKISDVKLKLDLLARETCLEDYFFSTKQAMNWKFFAGIKRNVILGNPSPSEANNPFNKLTQNGIGWIITLVSHNQIEPCYITNSLNYNQLLIYLYNFDEDIISSYPLTTYAWKVSKSTCKAELVSIEGLSEMESRIVGLNVSGGRCNAQSISRSVYNLPSFERMCEEFETYLE